MGEVWGEGGNQSQAPDPCTSFPALPVAKYPSTQQSYQFPDETGISIGTPQDPQWIRLEIHYSNFHNLAGEDLEHLWRSHGGKLAGTRVRKVLPGAC